MSELEQQAATLQAHDKAMRALALECHKTREVWEHHKAAARDHKQTLDELLVGLEEMARGNAAPLFAEGGEE